MCKAKARLQTAHGYSPEIAGAWPQPGTIVTIHDMQSQTLQAECIQVTPIGILVGSPAEHTFIPWVAIQNVRWIEAETTAHGSDNVEDPEGRVGFKS